MQENVDLSLSFCFYYTLHIFHRGTHRYADWKPSKLTAALRCLIQLLCTN